MNQTTLSANPAPVGSPDNVVASAQRTFGIEAEGIKSLSQAFHGVLGERFVETVEMLKATEGRVLLSGMGKSGQIARKIVSTLSSTGTPALFVHPSEASHGDLGMIASSDVVIILSWSGETVELKDIVAYSRRFTVPLIAITAHSDSTLAKSADVVLQLPIHEEACPNGLAPTTSTTMQLVLGDAIAIALLESKGFTSSDFKVLHPGGKLGAALTFVRDVMHTGEALPIVGRDTTMAEALMVMTEKSFGCLAVTTEDGRLAGIVTDGDLRRSMAPDLLSRLAGDVMTPDPKVISPDDLASSALEILNSRSITSLFVTTDNKPIGIVHIHDLLRVGVA